MATLLEIVQEFCGRTGLSISSSVVNSGDTQLVQIRYLLNEVCEELTGESWQVATQEAVFTTVAGEAQGSIATLAPNGFQSIIEGTFFDRTLRRPMFGGLTASEWQERKALVNPGPFYQFRLVRDQLYFMPAPPAGHICAFEYHSSYVIKGDNGIAKAAFTSDTDVFLLSKKLILAGLRWKWKNEKGLDYAEDFRRYETIRTEELGRDKVPRTLRMDGSDNGFRPGIWVPSGNWPVT